MKKIFDSWKYTTLLGLTIVLVGLGLRLYNLTILPIFADEAIYIRWAQVMKAEPTLRFLPLSDGKQPLFMWSVIPFLKVFSDPLFAGRFVSVVAGVVTLIGIFLLSFVLFKSKRSALVASFIYAISPFSIFFDRMALVDSMLTLFGVLTFLFGFLTAKTLRLDFAMLTGFALGGAYLTKSPALFFAILFPSLWLFAPWKREWKSSLRVFVKLIFLTGVVYLITLGMYNILRLGPNFHLINLRNQDYVFPLDHLWTNLKDPFIFHFDRAIEWISTMGPGLILFLAFLGMFVNGSERFKETFLIFVWFIIPIAVQAEFARVFTARYILSSLPYLFILAGSAFLGKEKRFSEIAGASLLIFSFLALRFDYFLLTDPERAYLPNSERSGYLEEWTAGTGIKEASNYIKGVYNQKIGQKIVVGTEGFFGTLPDGLQIYLNDIPEITVLGVGINIDQVPTSLSESASFGNKTYLLVNSSRFKIKDSEDAGLELVNVYPKAFRLQKDTHEYLWYGLRDSLYLFEVKLESPE